MPVTEISPSSLKIDKIINRIEEGEIKIPAFQRGFVWSQEQVIELLDSIYKDYPIGSILLWSSKESLQSTRNIGGFLLPEREPEYPTDYVLDGQQRLSTIYAIFCKDRSKAPEINKYSADTKIFEVFFDLKDKKFVAKEDLNKEHPNLNLNTLFDVVRFISEIKEFVEEYQRIAQNVLEKFQNYEISIVTTRKRRKEDAGIIFERINNTGTKLTTLDFMVACTWSDEFLLREEIDNIKETLEEKGFGDTPDKIILQCISGIIEKTSKTKDILSLKAEAVRLNIDKLKDSLEKTIDFLSTELNVNSRDFLPHSHQIVPLTFFFSIVDAPTLEQSKTLKHWFWKTSFSKRYSGSTDMKMNEDISFFEKVINNDFSGINKYSYTVTKDTLITQKFSKSVPYTRAFLLLLAQNEPLNLVNGTKIDLGNALSKYNSKEYHHIFPRTYLKTKDVDSDRIASLCNFCFLPSISNKTVSNKAPSDYIFNVVPSSGYSKILNSNLMPLKREIYTKNNYEEFLGERAQLILQYIESKLN
ncbi:MAG: GmrSD restriction endonuclease domain-containing protein [Candidatus Brocadiales bacterium]